MNWLLYGLFALASLIVALVGAALGYPEALFLLVLTAVASIPLVLDAIAWRKTRTVRRAGGGDTSVPATHIDADPSTPLGDTAEVHDEISPLDLPLDHPGRHQAEREAARSGGVTKGNTAGS